MIGDVIRHAIFEAHVQADTATGEGTEVRRPVIATRPDGHTLRSVARVASLARKGVQCVKRRLAGVRAKVNASRAANAVGVHDGSRGKAPALSSRLSSVVGGDGSGSDAVGATVAASIAGLDEALGNGGAAGKTAEPEANRELVDHGRLLSSTGWWEAAFPPDK